MNNNRNNMNNNENNERGANPWLVAGGLAVGAALFGGMLYKLTGSSAEKPVEQQQQEQSKKKPAPRSVPNAQPLRGNYSEEPSVSSYLSDFLSRMSTSRGGTSSSSVTIEELPNIPDNPSITNLNSLLSDIHVRFIKLSEFSLHYKVFDTIFQDLHRKMKEVDAYYRKYSSTVQFAGSHFDNLRIVKPDEFDMDIVIGLPLNIKTDALNPAGSDITIEPKAPGFVELSMGVQFQRLPFRDGGEWLNNKAAFEWIDNENYLLRSKFSDWFKGVVSKALNKCEVNSNSRPLYYVEGVPYVIDKSESGPAMTLLISNKARNFKMDVDLVPCLKFPEDRWPISTDYRQIPPECKKGYWMVVGKPNKAAGSRDQSRSWRIALHNQERQLMHNSFNLRQAIRLIKKLRDSLGMKHIASYYVKTLFFWEIVAINNADFWQKNNPANLFKMMVKRLHEALVTGNIPYFWNKKCNLIGGVERNVLNEYRTRLEPLLVVLEQPAQYKVVAKYLLTPAEFADYNAKFLHI